MNTLLVKIRLQQISRESGGLGAFYLLLLAAAIALMEYGLYRAYLQLDLALFSLAIIMASTISFHLARKDSYFVWRQLSNPKKLLFTEYSLFSLPFILPAVLTWQFWIIPVYILAVLLLVQWRYFPPQRQLYWAKLSRLLPVRYFEWLAGIRKLWLPLLILYLTIWSFCWVRAFPILGLWVMTLFLATFYTEGEPLNILRQDLQNPRQFIWRKIKRHLGLMSCLYIPPLVVNAIIHADIFYVHIIFLFMQLVALFFVITLKYSLYEPNIKIKGNNVIQGFALMGTIVQYLAPLPLFLCFWYYFKALQNLKKYTL